MSPKSRTIRRGFDLLVLCAVLFSMPGPAMLPLLVQAREAQPELEPVPNMATEPAPAATIGLFRTRVALHQVTSRARLDELGIVVLDEGEDWAVVLVDDEQLETLARLRFGPQASDDMAQVWSRHQDRVPYLASTLAPLLEQVTQVAEASETDTATEKQARDDLHAALHDLTPMQQVGILSLPSDDDDADGLTNTQEQWWCLDPLDSDTDDDGISDKDEIDTLKQWMNNERNAPPYATPWPSWPFDPVLCPDKDHDSIPNLAERWELGLNMDLESTDRDRYDDGQELFGTTYCPGSANACGYGQMPSANHDGILLFPQMPTWVTAPGNHPFVAALPHLEFSIVPDNDGKDFKMQTATVVTTDERHEEGETKSYETTETNGTGTSDAQTETWERWQEYSKTTEATTQRDSLVEDGDVNLTSQRLQMTNIRTTNVSNQTANLSVNNSYQIGTNPGLLDEISTPVSGFVFDEACAEFNCTKYAGSAIRASVRTFADVVQGTLLGTSDKIQNEFAANKCSATSFSLNEIACRIKSAGTLWKKNYDERLASATAAEQDAARVGSGNYLQTGPSYLDISRIYPLAFPEPRFVPTETNTRGSSVGGARTTTHTSYQEHAVTEGTAKQFGQSWGTATAQNTVHAADLWFAYELSNTGSDYARVICDLAINVYIGDQEIPAVTYYPGNDLGGDGCFNNFQPGESHCYSFPSESRIALTLDQMAAIDLGEPVRFEIEDFTLGQDDFYADDAIGGGVTIAIDDGMTDNDDLVETFIIPTWGEETVLDVLGRFFPDTTDSSGLLTEVWTPEHREDTPAWCIDPRAVGSGGNRTLWCKKSLSTADWWNIYTDGLGGSSEGLQNTAAQSGSIALFRFNKDTDLDGYSDRSETRLGTDPNDPASHPQPELLAGLHTIREDDYVTATLSLLNTGLYDAYGVEAVMIAPNDTISITNNTVGGSGRVRALRDVVVGSRILPASYDAASWHGDAQPFSAGYYTGAVDRVYTFTALDSAEVSSNTLRLAWHDGLGVSGTLACGAGYASPTPLGVGGYGVQVGLLSGEVQAGDIFSVTARTPRDTFQYAINAEPYTPPVVLVSYNDPQGNHRFVTPVTLTTPTEDLVPYSGQMLEEFGVEIVTQAPITATGTHTTNLVVNWPVDVTLEDAHLFLEFVNISGTVASEVPVTVTVAPGPNVVPVVWDTAAFSPTFQTDEDYIVMAFWTDWQGNILDTAGRPLSSFQEDPKPTFAMASEDMTWDFGTVTQGMVLKHNFSFANTGFQDLLTYVNAPVGMTLSQQGSRSVEPADVTTYEITLDTANLSTGPYNQTIEIRSSDPEVPVQIVHVVGAITGSTPDIPVGAQQRPLDWPVTFTSGTQGQWVQLTHTLEPNPQTLHPTKVYNQTYSTLWGVGKYATYFGEGTASYDMFGDGRDGDLVVSSGETVYIDGVRTSVTGSAVANQNQVSVTSVSGFNIGDEVLLIQMQGTNAGNYEFHKIQGLSGNTLIFDKNLTSSYGSAAATAVLFEHPNYSGRAETFTSNDSNLTDNYIGNDAASSIEIPAGSRATLYEHSEYSGERDVFAANDPNFGDNFIRDNRASSIRVVNAAKAQVLRVPNWRDLTVNGTLSAHAWDGSTGGILCARVSGSFWLSAGGSISLSGKGFRGGIGQTAQNWSFGDIRNRGQQGESFCGYGVDDSLSRNGGGGGGGKFIGGGGGGGYATMGGDAIEGFSSNPNALGGWPYGSADLSTIYLGSGGGGGGTDWNYGNRGYDGGPGGGAIALFASEITIQGQMSSSGSNAINNGHTVSGGGGGGAGGAILVKARIVDVGNNNVTSLGGSGNSGYFGTGGNGSVGRIRIEYCESLSGSTNPLASTEKLNCYIAEQIESSPYTSARLNLPETFSNGRTYQVQYGRRHVFSGAGEQTSVLRVPAAGFTDVRLDALVSGVGTGSRTFHLDVGDDGSWDWEWTGSVTNAITLSSADLSAAFSRYWATHGAPTSGTVDVPVKVYLSQAGQVLLSNLRATPTGSKVRYARLPVQTYTDVTLNLNVGTSGSGAVTVAADVGDDGTVDWTYTANSASYPLALTTGNLATAFNAYLAGHTGETAVPIRFYLAPFLSLDLNDFSATVSAQPDMNLTPGDIEFSAAMATEGDAIPVTITLHNDGALAATGHTAAFFAAAPGWGEWYVGSAYVPGIPAGLTATTTITWNTLGFTGTVPVRVVVDPYDRVSELDEENNEATTTFEVRTRPDLLVEGILLSDEEPMAGETVTVTLTLRNQGQTTSAEHTLSLYQGNPDDGGTPIAQLLQPSLTGGLTATVTIAWAPPDPGPYRLFVVVDEDDAVAEYDESNNERWHDVYVGFPPQVLLNSGTVTDPAYTPETGFGFVDPDGNDVVRSCGAGTQPYETLRRDPNGKVIYRFDHLLPGHFYHLDLTLYACDATGRLESIYVDGQLLAGPEDLGDGEIHRLSLRLDPALYADHEIEVTIEDPTQNGAIVNEVNLHDIDYRYIDAGGTADLPYEPSDGAFAHGWLDESVAFTNWGTLPYQSVRVNQDSDELRYRFDGLDPNQFYDVHLTFWQPSGASTIQKVRIDGLDTGLNVDTGDFAIHRQSVAIVPTTYASDGSIVISILRRNAQSGVLVNEIALEQRTKTLSGQCAVSPTPYFTDVYGNVAILDQPAPVGTVVQAFNPRGDVIGCFVVGNEGQYGFMRIYGEDTQVTPPIPGMRNGELVEFKVGGAPAMATPLHYWVDDHSIHPVDLNASALEDQLILLKPQWNLISFRMMPPIPTVERVFSSIDARYDRVLGGDGVYSTSLPDYNNLPDVHPGLSYYLYITNTTSVNGLIEGTPVSPTTPLALEEGWNWVGYLPTRTLPITVALQSIAGAYQLVLSLDKTYDPDLPDFSTLHEMEPGQGYHIYANHAVSLTYPLGATVQGATQAPQACGACTEVSATPHFTLVYGEVLINGRPAPAGTRVTALTPAGDVAGCSVVRRPGVLVFTHVFGADDTVKPAIPGFHEGEPLTFLVDGMQTTGQTLAWRDDWDIHEITLDITTARVFLPLMLRHQ